MKSDERHVHKVPLVHWLKPHEEVEWAALTKAGGPLPFSEIHIVDALSKEDVRVETGNEREVYLGILGWLPDGSELVFSRISRRFDRLDVMAADPETGVSRVIMTETQPTFIKGISINPGLPDLYTPLSDGERFLFISERDGWDHIYLYDMDGTLIRRLTRGAWPVRQIVSVDEGTGWVYFTAHAETDAIDPDLGVARLYDTNLYRVGLDGRPIEKLTEATGEHTIALSPSKRFFLDTHSTPERSPVVELRQADGRLIRSVSEADISGLADLEWSPPEEFVVKAADGTTDLYGVLFKPWDFDPAMQYPVIDYIYGGPYRTQAPHAFMTGTGLVSQAVAQLGYVVMMVDARGTPERGKAFQDVVYGNFGRHEIPDHVAALHGLAADRPYMDTERVGIFGGSWGGYMTVRAMVLAPETYDVGVSLYPVVDMYDHMSQAFEAYMGLPEDRPEAFEYGSSLRLADQLEGDLLLIHGTSDVNATFSATMKMVDALNRAGKPLRSHRLSGGEPRPRRTHADVLGADPEAIFPGAPASAVIRHSLLGLHEVHMRHLRHTRIQRNRFLLTAASFWLAAVSPLQGQGVTAVRAGTLIDGTGGRPDRERRDPHTGRPDHRSRSRRGDSDRCAADRSVGSDGHAGLHRWSLTPDVPAHRFARMGDVACNPE